MPLLLNEWTFLVALLYGAATDAHSPLDDALKEEVLYFLKSLSPLASKWLNCTPVSDALSSNGTDLPISENSTCSTSKVFVFVYIFEATGAKPHALECLMQKALANANTFLNCFAPFATPAGRDSCADIEAFLAKVYACVMMCDFEAVCDAMRKTREFFWPTGEGCFLRAHCKTNMQFMRPPPIAAVCNATACFATQEAAIHAHFDALSDASAAQHNFAWRCIAKALLLRAHGMPAACNALLDDALVAARKAASVSTLALVFLLRARCANAQAAVAASERFVLFVQEAEEAAATARLEPTTPELNVLLRWWRDTCKRSAERATLDAECGEFAHATRLLQALFFFFALRRTPTHSSHDLKPLRDAIVDACRQLPTVSLEALEEFSSGKLFM